MLTLLYCIDSLCNSGGTERVLTTKVNYLAKNGYIVHLFIRKEHHTPFFSLEHNIKLHFCGKDNLEDLRDDLINLLKEVNPDIVISTCPWRFIPKLKDRSVKVFEYHYPKDIYINFVKSMRKKPLNFLRKIKSFFMQYFLYRIIKSFDHVVVLTQGDLDNWHNPKNFSFIHNPLSFFSNKEADLKQKRIIGVGSFTPIKGFDQLIEAFALIHNKFPGWNLDIYGSGQDECYLNSLIDKYSLNDKVNLHAPKNQIQQELLASSIYAFPSRFDGFGLVITEAMECGLPCVAFDCASGPREIISDRIDGLLVPNQDIKSFSSCLEKLMSDEELRIKMGKKAKFNVERFYPEKIMPQWINLFSKLIEIERDKCQN